MSVLTLAEAAAYLRIDRNAVGHLVRTGQLRHKRIGNKYVFRREWLDEFLESEGRATTRPLTPRTRLALTRQKEGAPSGARLGS